MGTFEGVGGAGWVGAKTAFKIFYLLILEAIFILTPHPHPPSPRIDPG